MPATLSLCAIALDEEQMLGGLLDSVTGLVDEIVLGVDSRTTDATGVIGMRYGARFVDFDWRDDFAYARNLTLDAATSDWLLVLDPDERLLPAGAAVIRDIIGCAPAVPATDAVTGMSFWIEQRSLDHVVHVVQRSSARLFRNRPEIRYQGIVHEEPFWLPDPSQTTVLMVNDTEPHIAHYGYDPALWAERGKFERNVRLLSKRLLADPFDIHAHKKMRDLLIAATTDGA